jgi:hypothetical protein
VTQCQHNFEVGLVYLVISQDVVEEDRHRDELMDNQRILSWFQSFWKVVTSWGCCWLWLEPEPCAVEVCHVVTARQRDGCPAVVANENGVDGLRGRVTFGLLLALPIDTGLGLARLGNHDHVCLAGLKLHAQHAIFGELPLS